MDIITQLYPNNNSLFIKNELKMTKIVRIENADNFAYKVSILVQEKKWLLEETRRRAYA